MDPRSYYEQHARSNSYYQYSKRMDCNYNNQCDSDSSCDEIDTAPPCPYGIHCMKPLCVYSHPHARNNPLSIYQTASQPMPYSHQSYSNSYATYPQTPPWNPSSTNSQPHGYGQPSGVWPTPSSMSGPPPPIPNQGQYSTISQPTGYGQPSGVWPVPSSMSGPPQSIPNQGQSSTITSTRPMHKAPANSNFSQTMPIQQPSYVKQPELPKKSVASQQLNGGRSGTGSSGFTNNTMIERVPPAQVQTIAPYPVEGPINMPQPRRPVTNTIANNNVTQMPQPRKPATNPIANNNVMQMPQPRRPPTNPIPSNKSYQPAPTAELENTRLRLEQTHLAEQPNQPRQLLPQQPQPNLPTKNGSLSQTYMKATAPMVEEHAQSTSSQPTRKNDESMDENLCCICLENKPEIVLIPCGHAKFCQGCADQFKECPICRSKVVMKQRIFL